MNFAVDAGLTAGVVTGVRRAGRWCLFLRGSLARPPGYKAKVRAGLVVGDVFFDIPPQF